MCTNKIEEDCVGYDENLKKVGLCNSFQRQISISKCLVESPGQKKDKNKPLWAISTIYSSTKIAKGK